MGVGWQRHCPWLVDELGEWNWHRPHNARSHPHHRPAIEIWLDEVRTEASTHHHREQSDNVYLGFILVADSTH
jgi:hypothetical protein